MKPWEILVVQRIVPHYRVPFFQRLAASERVHLRLAYGRERRNSALESIQEVPGVRRYALRNSYLAGKDTLVYQWGLSGLVARTACDAIIAEYNPRIVSNVLACFQARRLKIPFLWWGQGLAPHPSAAASALRVRLAVLSQAVILYDSRRAEQIISLGVPRDKVFVAWNSPDTEAMECRRAPYRPEERTRVVCVGRLVPEKKPCLLVQAFAEARGRLPAGTRLSLIGDGPERERVRRLASELGVAAEVDLPGGLYDQQALAPWLNSAWISVSPGFVGLSAIHSLAYGVPMFTADREPHSPEVTALEEGVNALFFPSGDLRALADALIRLRHEPARLAAMSQASTATVAGRYSLSAMVSVFEQAIKFALGK